MATTRWSALAVTRYDVVVLDRDLPGVPGDEVCRQVVAGSPQTRVLMLTAASTVRDRVDGLGLGADDYPAQTLRLRGAHRPRAGPGAGAPRPRCRPSWNAATWTLDPNRRAASRAGRRLELSPKEFALLECLLASAGRWSRPRSCSSASGTRRPTRSPTAVKTTVRRLRGKLGEPPVIHTERGGGYRLWEA